jgi:hypothetical protein
MGRRERRKNELQMEIEVETLNQTQQTPAFHLSMIQNTLDLKVEPSIVGWKTT